MVGTNTSSIPEELKALAQWVAWRREIRGEKTTKVPYNPQTGSLASSADPMTWGAFPAVLSRAESAGYHGIGFVFTKSDPYCGIDLDKVIDEKGETAAAAIPILKGMRSYTEVTPSGRGYHIIVKAKLPAGGKRADQIEIYDSGRYFTFTGNCPDEDGPKPIREAQKEVDDLLAAVAKPVEQVLREGAPVTPINLSDQELLDKATRASNGTRFADLYNGNWESDYRSQSEADMALCGMLAFWTQRDATRMDDLFRRSNLYRKKWDEPHYQDGSTYGAVTVANAIQGCRQIYEPGRPNQPEVAGPAEPRTASNEDSAQGDVPLPQHHPERKRARDFMRPQEIAESILSEDPYLSDQFGSLYRYNNTCWREISEAEIRHLAMELDDLLTTKLNRRKEVVSHIQDKSLVEGGIIPWRSIAHSEIPVANGVVDVTTGLIRPHRKEDYLESVIPYDYDPAAQAPRWERALQRWFNQDRDGTEKITALQEFFGYTLLPHALFKKALVLYGDGDTGKSLLIQTAIHIVGGTARACEIKLDRMDDPRAIAPIFGKWLNVVSELPADALVKDGGFKQLISNGDPITVDPKFKTPFTYVPFAKHIIACNSLPSIGDYTNATFNRLLILSFNHPLSATEKDAHLLATLKGETPGILAWAIEGATRLVKNGGEFTQIGETTELLADYKEEQNPVFSFLAEECEPDEDGKILLSKFVGAFNVWHTGKSHYGNKTVAKMAKAAGCKVVKRRVDGSSNSTRCVCGYRLLGGRVGDRRMLERENVVEFPLKRPA